MSSCGFHYLKIFIENKDDFELIEKYTKAIEKHNEQSNSTHPNAGFDIFQPIEITVKKSISNMIGTGIIASMSTYDNINLSYYMYPRSSLGKTPLRLGNSVGIIDAGYRGELKGLFDKHQLQDYKIEKHSRLLQICSPTLNPIIVELVDNIEDLGITDRGNKGFGSSGK